MLLSIVSNIITLINNGSMDQKIELEATANVDNLQIPVNMEFKLGQ